MDGIVPLLPHPEHQNSMGEALPLFVPDDSVEHFAANFHVTCGGAPLSNAINLTHEVGDLP
jgi:hypothetical protein